MKITHKDLKAGTAKVHIESLDDLWYLNQIIDPTDSVSAKTFRKIKLGEGTDRKQQVVKKPVFLKISVAKVDFSASAHELRISGTVLEGPEDVPHGSHHTIAAGINDDLTIHKERWLSYQVEKLEEAAQANSARILICVHDREEAVCALTKKYGYEMLAHIQGTVVKKGDVAPVEANFYSLLKKQLQAYDERYELQTIILASPAFWKDELLKLITDEKFKKKIITATCSSVGENAVTEVLKRPETQAALQQDRIAKEHQLVEKLYEEIAKSDKAAYGMKEVSAASDAGAIETLLVTDTLISKKREDGTFMELDTVMKATDAQQAHILIVNAEHEPGQRLNGLTGIGAILRYKINY